MTTQLIVRYGPAPGDTEDAAGRIHSTFTGFFVLSLTPENTCRFFGTDDATAADPEAFTVLVRQVWAQATAPPIEAGHILLGACSSFEYVINNPPTCGFQLGTAARKIPFAPKDYVPLYAVTRAKKPTDGSVVDDAPNYIDIAIDYRGTSGPGDETISPTFFGSAAD